MGYAVAEIAAKRGAEVVLVSGPTSLAVPAGVRAVKVRSAREMEQAVLKKSQLQSFSNIRNITIAVESE